MRGLVTRALAVAATLAAALVLVTAVVLTALDARDRARTADDAERSAIVAVLSVTTDADTLRAALARTKAGSEGRLAVRLGDGRTIGVGGDHPDPSTDEHVPTASGGTAIVSITAPAPVVTRGLVLEIALLLLLAGLGATAAVALGRRMVTPALDAVRVLSDTAEEIGRHDVNVRIRLTGPAELVALADAINAAADRTGRLLAKEREMIADVSHRLRTPLTALRLDAESIGSGPVAERIRRAVTSMEHDVDRIIQSVHHTPGDFPRTCDVGAVVRSRMVFWTAYADDQGRLCDVDLPYEPAPVELSAEGLGAVVDALMDNVFHHTPPSTEVGVAVVSHAGWITLVVDDAGPGVADPEAALLRGASGRGSTGLGLDIARAAVESTGGTIHVERGKLGGARIRLRFAEADSHHERENPRAWRLWGKRH
ncbi:HAMP domain-containing sensor histidine kinase [Umezawaea sp. Da 62-37]|uniref:sensor histidine kinase n=1 Tax=Umezawaea sp. Da 62-37 TaxID=3075927 RepID=UPI0028F746FD|nr:HAMP domain-containing sensor histidine kinase [Umezawaea sp. Da 62-37]WNV90593.1 HAMP domain-containing sensor histidine kinase [Umezawaea sp. Da 62-37]